MNKKEVGELLNKINNHYFGKIAQFMNDKSFFEDWSEALKDYDYELVKSIYHRYDNTDFPPSAKYFQVEADKAIDRISTAIVNVVYSLTTNCYLSGDPSNNRAIIENKLSEYPYDKRLKVLDDIVAHIPINAPSYSVDLSKLLKEYRYEY